MVILSGEELELKGEALSVPESIEIVKGNENRLFEQYAGEHPRRVQTLSAWIYLNQIYQSDSLFAMQEEPRKAITQEMGRIRREDNAFIEELDSDSYLRWYLQVRKLVNSVPVVAQIRTEEIPQTIQGFRELDHTDERLHRSGLLGDVIESHVWLIENSGRSLDSVFVELDHSIDILTDQLAFEPALFNEIMEYLFDLLQQRSLYTSSEHLALSLLDSYSDLIRSRLASKLEIYRTTKPGNTAPDIDFTKSTLRPNGIIATRLSEIDADYILVIFAAGWCPHCRQMKPELLEHYPAWREAGVEVVLVSLDDSPESFEQFASDLNLISTTDFQRWDSPMVKEYHVNSIPAMVLLDQNLEILIHPNSIQHMDAWVDWYLVQGKR
ncbi:MAG: redoxin domain-containing protein [Balneolaceae bacterium]|nr:redoxin domain-containing protein [Balneolaceae bacterium]